MRAVKENFGNSTATVEITTEHSASSYGVPVVLVNGKLLGDVETTSLVSENEIDPNAQVSGYEIKLMMAHGNEKHEYMKGAIKPYFVAERDAEAEKEWESLWADTGLKA